MSTAYSLRLFGLMGFLGVATFIPEGWFNAGMKASVHVHFILAYLYQFRGGQYRSSFVFRFACSAIFLGLCYFLFVKGPILQAFSSVWFLLHFFSDEVHLLGKPADTKFSSVLGLIIWSHLPVLFPILGLSPISKVQFLGIGLVLVFVSVFRLSLAERRSTCIGYLLAFGVTAFLLRALDWQPYVRNQFNISITYHIYISYVHPFVQQSWSSAKRRQFLVEACGLNGVFIYLGLVQHFSPVGLTEIVFSNDFFNFAACLHFVSSNRMIRKWTSSNDNDSADADVAAAAEPAVV